MSLFGKKNYNIDEEENVPQFVYGIPDNMRKQWEIEKEEQEKEEKLLECFEGGYFGPSYYFYINKVGDNYQFRFGYSKDGRFVKNSLDDENLNIIPQSKQYYDTFIEELANIIREWDSSYNDPDVMDGTQWHLDILESDKHYWGSNKFPNNYGDLTNLLQKYFHVDEYIAERNKYDVEAEDNIPYEVYGIPDFVRQPGRYVSDFEDDNTQEVFKNPNEQFNNNDTKVADIAETKTCPYCGSTELWKYLYGNPMDDYDRNIYILGGNEEKLSSPQYKCKKCEKDIYENSMSLVMDDLFLPKKKYSIRVEIQDYVLVMDGEECRLSFANLKESDAKMIQDLSTKIPKTYYDSFIDRLFSIIHDWQDNYDGNRNIHWNIRIIEESGTRIIMGNGGFPSNWNQFIDLLSEYEILFKQKKQLDIEKEKIDTEKSSEE